MKRIYWLTIILLLTVQTAAAQTQQGVVKTRGRMVNGKHVAGKGLSGATVQVQGRSAVVSRQNGAFSFPVLSQSFLVQSVTKQGYRLVDDDATRKPYQPSANPIYLVMETPDQQMQDKLDAERKLRRTLQRQLQQREDEIEAMNVSLQEKQRMLQQLYQDQQNNEKLIADMAKQYAAMDYDQMDALNQRISDCILNGRLTEADSLLRSKGDMNDRIAEIRREQQAEAKEEANLAKRQADLAASKAGTQKKLEDAASDCYKFFDRFKLANQHDSATYYIELHAALDTTNVEWQNEAGQYISAYIGDYREAMTYCQRVLRQSVLQYGEEHDWTAKAYNNIGSVYHSQGDYAKALEYHFKASAIWEKVLGPEHPDVATSYNNIGVAYNNQGDYVKALEYHFKALAIREEVLGPEHPDVAASYNNIGSVYYSQEGYAKALEYHSKALAILEKVLGSEHPNVAASYNNIGSVYSWQGDYVKALEYHSKALAIREKVLGTEHPDVAVSYSNIGNVYNNQGDYAKALEYHSKALAIREKVLGAEHPDVATSYNNIGSVYYSQGDYAKTLEYFSKALAIQEKVLGAEHPDVAEFCANIAMAYFYHKEYTKAIEYFKKALKIYEKRNGEDDKRVKLIKKNIIYVEKIIIPSDPEQMKEYVFTATVVDGDCPARQQGMSGEYVMLGFADWSIESAMSLFDKNAELRGKPKTLVVIQDGNISQHHFENTIGVIIGIKHVGNLQKTQVIGQYREWKSTHRP